MKLVQDLPEVFEEFGEQRRKAFIEIKEYKEKGVPVVGMYCAYFPTELAMAVGAIPVGLCSFSNETIPAAEQKMPKSMCPLVKSSYGFAISDKCPFFHFSDLIIGETTCDGKKKMYEMLAEFKPVFVMELPNSQSRSSMEFWRSEVIRTKEYFEDFFQTIITEEKIKEAIHLGNEIRKSLLRLCEVMKLEPAPVLGGDLQKIVSGSKYRFDFKTTPAVVDAITDRILEEYHQGKMLESRPRILVTGCPMGGDSLKVIQAIEENGGVVVAVENCSGVKTLDRMIDEEDPDIYGAIARRYLSTGCSIMTPNDNRIELIGRIIDEYHVDGVVEMILSGCHATGAEAAYIQQFVTEEKGLPYLSIDTDYSKEDYAQISTRVAALIEMIYDNQAGDAKIDINNCYKILFSNLATPADEALEQLYAYTKIPMKIEDAFGKVLCMIGMENVEGHENKQVRFELPEIGAVCTAFPKNHRLRMKAEQIAEIIGKYCAISSTSLQADHKSEERPDYLWIVLKDDGKSKPFREELRRNFRVMQEIEDGIYQHYLLSDISGKEYRDNLIVKCKDIYEQLDIDVKVAIGNGFSKLSQKSENEKVVQMLMEIGEEWEPDTNIYQIEYFYQELLMTSMKAEIAEMDGGVEELRLIREEDEQKKSNLYETLYYYLEAERNTMQAAAKMKIHRNTLLYRLARINELIHLDEKGYMESQRLLRAMQFERIAVNKNR